MDIDLNLPLNVENISKLLKMRGKDALFFHKHSAFLKRKIVGDIVYFRGLIEFSNRCQKNCFYCGIRASNKDMARYEVQEEEVFKAVDFALKKNYASVVLQAGERNDPQFVSRIAFILKEIQKRTEGKIAVTLSLGEQTQETYEIWKESGASRYLLRIETTSQDLYEKIHPNDDGHSFVKRLECLKILKKLGYQVGSGVMFGLPFQSYEDMARDLLFFKEFDVDMVGMGPYIEHEKTPLYEYKDELLPLSERFEIAINAISLLRILMPDINIAATTALQAIDKKGREKAISVGANVLMPNLTPSIYKENYLLYKNKPGVLEEPQDLTENLEKSVAQAGNEIGFGKWGDSKHYLKNKKK